MAKRWIQIAPLGEYPHPAGVVQVIDAPAIAAMAAAFDPARKALIDFDHYSDLSNAQRTAIEEADVSLPSEAAGWIEALDARPDGLYGLADMTPEGEMAIRNGEYRFLSPVWLRRDCEDAGQDRLRPKRLHKIGLTNEPNIRDLRPLVNRRRVGAVTGPLAPLANSAPVEPPATVVEPEPTEIVAMDYRAKLIVLLGLDADATDEQIMAAIEAMKNSEAEEEEKRKAEMANAEEEAKKREEEVANAEAAAKAKDEEIADLKNRLDESRKATLAAQVETDLVEFAGVIKDKAATRKALLSNREAARAVLANVRPPALPNRADGSPPIPDTKPELTGIDRARAAFAATAQ
jgi:phage I-like protein